MGAKRTLVAGVARWLSPAHRVLEHCRQSRGSVGCQWRPQQGHPVSLEDGGNDLSIWIGTAGNWPELLVELVSASWRVDDHDLAGLIGQVQEGMRDARRKVRKPAFIAVEDLVADPDLVP